MTEQFHLKYNLYYSAPQSLYFPGLSSPKFLFTCIQYKQKLVSLLHFP